MRSTKLISRVSVARYTICTHTLKSTKVALLRVCLSLAFFNHSRWSERLGIGTIGKLTPEIGGVGCIAVVRGTG